MFNRRDFIAGAVGMSTLPFFGNFAFASTDDTKKKVRRGGTLTVAVTPEPPLLTSAFHSGAANGIVSTKMMEGLIAYDQELNLHPLLAKSWEWSEDGLSLTFHLQENVKWHDGAPFTSKDVAFSLMTVSKELHSYGRSAFANMIGVDTPDDHTAIIRLSAPAKYMMGIFSSYISQILPAHLFEGTDIRTNPYNQKPVGTGPFKFKEWVKGSHVSLVRNDDYWRKDEPYLDGVVFRFIPDAGARYVAFKSGEVQMGFDAVPVNELKGMKDSGDFIVTTDGGEYTAPIFLHELNTRRAPFDNIKVRRAMLHAINREALIKIVWGGIGEVATGPVPRTNTQFYNPNTVQYPYDPERAEELLDEAGYHRKKDGIRFTMFHDFLPF
ncbi:MAG: ABC transporter substrate-binding protein, partial [Alphaproteobacteria bacterium]